MLYITGDTHGSQYKWVEQIDLFLKPGDTIIVAGDFGIGFWNGRYWPEEMFFDWLEEQPYTVLFCDGNHCNFDILDSYPVTRWNGGNVHLIRKNLIHLMRGEIFRIDGKTFFVMGGGYSLDKYLRTEGLSWWPREMPSEEEYENARNNLNRAGSQVDYIITHTAPAETVYDLSLRRQLGIRGDVTEELELTTFLNHVQATVSYKCWYFGHFHIDLELRKNQIAIFNTIREVETGKILRQWETYEG